MNKPIDRTTYWPFKNHPGLNGAIHAFLSIGGAIAVLAILLAIFK